MSVFSATAQRPIDGLAHRILGNMDTCFVFVYQPDTVDFFLIEPDPDNRDLFSGKIRITGNNDNSLATGLNYYLKHIAGVHVSWLLCEPVELPLEFRMPAEPIRKEALVKDRFFLNYCTYGYTMPWWKWPQWERFIDRMALNGITMPLAITGQEAVWYEVWKEFGMTDEEIRSYFSGPAHLPWHRMANLDGNTMLVGNINELEKKLDAALKEAGPNMAGIGSTLESFDVSPQIYEYLFDRVWENQPNVHNWIKDWNFTRMGTTIHEDKWLLLNDSVYKDWSFYGFGTQLVARPSLEGHGTYYTKPYYSYSNDTLKSICAALVNKYSYGVSRFSSGTVYKDTYKYDLVNFFSQWMGNHFMDIHNDFTIAYKNRDIQEMERQVEIASQLFADVDTLLNTHPAFMLGPWIEAARDWGTTKEEKDYYERQARTLLTIWGGPVLNDYANRMWGGLVSDYYAKRWNLFFEAVIQAVKEGKEFDEKSFGEKLSKFEHKWTESHTKYPAEPLELKCELPNVSGVPCSTFEAARTIYERWMEE